VEVDATAKYVKPLINFEVIVICNWIRAQKVPQLDESSKLTDERIYL
jgi:hypothetical protein